MIVNKIDTEHVPSEDGHHERQRGRILRQNLVYPVDRHVLVVDDDGPRGWVSAMSRESQETRVGCTHPITWLCSHALISTSKYLARRLLAEHPYWEEAAIEDLDARAGRW